MDRIKKRFETLLEAAKLIDDNSSLDIENVPSRPGYIRGSVVSAKEIRHVDIDWQAVIQWSTSVMELLRQLFGENSPTYSSFSAAANANAIDGLQRFQNMLAVFRSAKEQWEGGYVFEIKNLANAEAFDDELGQAEYLHDEDYLLPAAVIAGTVLETTLRTLCEQSPSISLPEKPTGSDMNNKLKKPGGVINETERSQNDAWIKIRNLAAHGKPEFASISKNDIKRMIDGIRDFVTKHMK